MSLTWRRPGLFSSSAVQSFAVTANRGFSSSSWRSSVVRVPEPGLRLTRWMGTLLPFTWLQLVIFPT